MNPTQDDNDQEAPSEKLEEKTEVQAPDKTELESVKCPRHGVRYCTFCYSKKVTDAKEVNDEIEESNEDEKTSCDDEQNQNVSNLISFNQMLYHNICNHILYQRSNLSINIIFQRRCT